MGIAALFLGDFRFGVSNWFSGHAWSLAVEEQFYILFPLFWVVCPPRLRAKILIGLLALFSIWGIFHTWGYTNNFIAGSAVVGFSCITVGALLALNEERALRFVRTLPSFPVSIVSILILLYPIPATKPWEAIFSLLVPFAVGLILMHSVGHPGWVSSALKRPAIQWWGLVSYSAYLWQEMFTAESHFYGSPSIAFAFHVALLSLPVIAGLSYYAIDRPSTRFGRRLAKRIGGRRNTNLVEEIASS
jgi:peptidoglycan/LPS O-acetylase OafA/YrhL